MSSVLESVEWGNPVLSLLSHCPELDPNIPAIMHLRHTERPMLTVGSPDNYEQRSTELGKKAAYELGTKLPTNRNYRIYHTLIERTKETAIEIKKGIASNNVSADIIGAISLSSVVNRAKFSEIAARELKHGVDAEGIFSKWLSGHYPPWVRVPALDFSQRGASIMMENYKALEASSFDVYVSHDIFIAVFLLHWFGIVPLDVVEFLDGFILQFYGEKIMVFTKLGKKEILSPYWWNFTK